MRVVPAMILFATLAGGNAAPPLLAQTTRIVKPRVDKRLAEYPDVRFSPGDRVSIRAGGCVFTNGKWRSYVDPYGKRSDRESGRLFHGLIWIPGATPGLVRIASVVGKELTVPTAMRDASTLFLRVGYEADEGHFPQAG